MTELETIKDVTAPARAKLQVGYAQEEIQRLQLFVILIAGMVEELVWRPVMTGMRMTILDVNQIA